MDARRHEAFAAALLDPAIDPTPALDAARRDGSAQRRFDVHRNTVVVGLVRALAEGFPSIERLVGSTFFAAMAADFVRRHPPRHPVLLAYGDAFPGFLEAFPPVAQLPYLADVARLDGLRRRAWHAPDATALKAASFVGRDPEAIGRTRIGLHPSLGLLASPHPALSLWEAQNGDGAATTPVPVWEAETAMVWRSDAGLHAAVVDAPLLHLLDAARRAPTFVDLLAVPSPCGEGARARAFVTALDRGLLVSIDTAQGQPAPIPGAALFDGFLPPFPTASHPGSAP